MMLKTKKASAQGIAAIKEFEGFSPHVYKDAAGLPTIGYGHLIKPGETFPEGVTEKEAESMLMEDLETAENAVNRLVKVPLTKGQRDALISFTYNLGQGNLAKSTLLKRLNNNDYESIPNEFMRWIYAGGEKINGLVTRRAREIDMWRS